MDIIETVLAWPPLKIEKSAEKSEETGRSARSFSFKKLNYSLNLNNSEEVFDDKIYSGKIRRSPIQQS
jgi:hypothetical protein